MRFSATRAHFFLAAPLVGLFAFAFVAASRPCERALDTWAYVGVSTLVVLVVLPFALPATRPVDSPLGSALILGGATVMVWIAGLFAADIPIVCRLF